MRHSEAVTELEWLYSYQGCFAFGNNAREAFSNGIRVVSKRNVNYNCFAYALGKRHWVEMSCRQYINDQMKEEYGFLRGSMRKLAFEPDTKKIVLYAVGDMITHAAVRVCDGWYSKMGCGGVLFHLTLWLLAGRTYGKPFACFVKARR
jgi:hypothetical protein